jgi:ABC-type anion transport system duplicated permease subunit
MDEAPSNNAGDRAEEGSNGALATASQAGWLNFALWGVLILGIIVIVIMIFILMKRQRNKTEDLLL